jgi:hypothetical protein
MCVIDIDECNCLCHTGATVAHMMACCEQCPNCGKRIKYGIRRHLEEHEKQDLKDLDLSLGLVDLD